MYDVSALWVAGANETQPTYVKDGHDIHMYAADFVFLVKSMYVHREHATAAR